MLDLLKRLIAVEKRESMNPKTDGNDNSPKASYSGMYSLLGEGEDMETSEKQGDDDIQIIETSFDEDAIVENETTWILKRNKRRRQQSDDSNPSPTTAGSSKKIQKTESTQGAKTKDNAKKNLNFGKTSNGNKVSNFKPNDKNND